MCPTKKILVVFRNPGNLSKLKQNYMCGEDFEWTNRSKGIVFGGVGGIFFGVGWWIFLNAASLHSSSPDPIPFSFYLPIIGQLLSFFMINLPAWSAISGDDSIAYDNADRVLCINRGIVMAGLFLEMSCVAGAVYILAGVYGEKDDAGFQPTDTLDGLLIFLSNLMVFLATWLMRWGTVPVDSQ